MPVERPFGAWFALARVEVAAPAGARAVVTFGDSITDGARSTTDTNTAGRTSSRARLAASKRAAKIGGAERGHQRQPRARRRRSGRSALARFDHDVLDQTGVTHVIVIEGINDIGDRAHERERRPPTI